MQNQSIATGTNTTARSSRYLALLALGSLVLLSGIIFSVIFISGEVRQYVSFVYMIEELEHGSHEKGQEALERYRADPLIFQLTKKVVYPFRHDIRDSRERATQNLSLVATKIGQNDFQSAALLFRDAVLPGLSDILATMRLSKEDKDLLHGILNRFDSWSKEVFTLAQLETTGPETIATNAKKLKEQTTLAGDVAMAFAQFLNLTPKAYGPNATMQFYKRGILKGLPLLEKLPDEIDNAHELKRKLDLLGGKPDVHGVNAPQQFQQRIKALRNNAAIFRKTITALEKENSSINLQITSLRKTVYTEAQKVRKDIIALIKEVAEPEISAPSSFALGFIR